jgi:gluconokinase
MPSSASRTAVLTLDIGTSSTRSLLYDVATCAAVPDIVATHAHQPHVTPDGGSTLDADAIVEEAVSCLEEVLEQAKDWTIVGVAVCTFWHSFLGVRANGHARTPILLWADRRSAPQVAELRERLDVPAYSQRTGCPLHVSFPPGRLLWLQENDPGAFTESARFMSPGEYLFSRLFGPEKVTCGVSMASGSGLWNARERGWDEETLKALGDLDASRFSPVGDAPATGLIAPYRERLEAVAEVPWFPAVGDGASSNIGCGATEPHQIALMIGTSAALRVTLPQSEPPTVPPGLWRYQASEERYLIGGALSNGGSVWAWLHKTLNFGELTDDTIEAQIAALPPDGHGLTVLPFFSGERAPLWRDELTATIHGISAATTTTQIARAHLEAVALRLAAVREAMRAVAPRADIIGTGAGLLASPPWAQMIADAIGEPIRLSEEEQASSRGAALLARERLGLGNVQDAPPVPVVGQADPHPAHTDIYKKAAERQAKLLETLWGSH